MPRPWPKTSTLRRRHDVVSTFLRRAHNERGAAAAADHDSVPLSADDVASHRRGLASGSGSKRSKSTSTSDVTASLAFAMRDDQQRLQWECHCCVCAIATCRQGSSRTVVMPLALVVLAEFSLFSLAQRVQVIRWPPIHGVLKIIPCVTNVW